MTDTYDDKEDERKDRQQQLALLSALGTWDRALRRDECGAWRINGEHGHIYTWGDGQTWVMWIGGSHRWSVAKKDLPFCKVTQNGDGEGCLRLFDLPTPEQVKVLRRILGLRKKREMSPEELERLRAASKPHQFVKKQPSKGSPVLNSPETTKGQNPALSASAAPEQL
jgi:hypothetical protein